MLGTWEIVIIVLVILLLFGGKKLPELARGLGKGLREFKNAKRDIEKEVKNAQAELDRAEKFKETLDKTITKYKNSLKTKKLSELSMFQIKY